MAVGVAGVAVLAAVVVIFAGAEARLVAVNVNGPPNEPEVIFWRVNVGGFGALVKLQRILANGFKLAAGIVITFPASDPTVVGLPLVAALVSVQTAPVKLKLLLLASVSVTGLPMLVTEM